MMDGVAGAGTGPAVVVDALRRRLAPVDAVDGGGGRQRGDYDLNPDWTPGGGARRLRDAAVLVPLVLRGAATGGASGASVGGAGAADGTAFGGGVTLILTRRSERLEAHAGQISFPGGRVEAGDAGAAATALRETEEEIGLAREAIELIGRLDTYVTRTGFRVTPVVGLVRPPFSVCPRPEEVAEVFEVPLALLLGPGLPEQRSRDFMGTQRRFYVFPCQGRTIWGATAGMLVNLRDVLLGAPSSSCVNAGAGPSTAVRDGESAWTRE